LRTLPGNWSGLLASMSRGLAIELRERRCACVDMANEKK
jgi:hypothetical protein